MTQRNPAGLGRLTVARVGPRSVVTEAFASSPLRVLTPANHGHAAWVYSSSYGGGLLDGDVLSMHTTVGPRACAFVSTQASTKVYKSPRGTRVEMTADVADDGLLVLAPDPVVCFAGSTYRQFLQFDLSSRAGLVAVDWVSSGRRESGERWAFDEYHSGTVVRFGGRLAMHDALALRASDGDLATRLGRYDVLAVAVDMGVALSGDVERIMTRVNSDPPTGDQEQLVTASAIGASGCVVRVAGRSVEAVGYTLQTFLDFVPARLGDSPWARKW